MTSRTSRDASTIVPPAVFLPDLPNNEGMVRPVRVVVPERSLLNPLFPAAVGCRAATGHYVPALIFGALHQAVPAATA